MGALTSKVSRSSIRAWELLQCSTISGVDSICAHVYAHINKNILLRIIPRENEYINETWISDKDRFAYTAVYNDDRIKFPMIKQSNKWIRKSWEEILNIVLNIIRNLHPYARSNCNLSIYLNSLLIFFRK